MESPDSPCQRLLLALSILSGRRTPLSLAAHEAELLGVKGWVRDSHINNLIQQTCETLLADAILAGGYQ